MVGTVVYICMHAQNREAAQNTSLCSLFDTFAYSRDLFLRDRAADNGGLEDVYKRQSGDCTRSRVCPLDKQP